MIRLIPVLFVIALHGLVGCDEGETQPPDTGPAETLTDTQSDDADVSDAGLDAGPELPPDVLSDTSDGATDSVSDGEVGTDLSEETDEGIEVSDTSTDEGLEVSDTGTDEGLEVSDTGADEGLEVSDTGADEGLEVSDIGVDVSDMGPDVGDTTDAAETNAPVPYVRFIEHVAKTEQVMPLADGGLITVDAIVKHNYVVVGQTAFWLATRYDSDGALLWSMEIIEIYQNPQNTQFLSWDFEVISDVLVLEIDKEYCSLAAPDNEWTCSVEIVPASVSVASGEPTTQPSTPAPALPPTFSATYESCGSTGANGQIRVTSAGVTAFVPLPFAAPTVRATSLTDDVVVTATESRRTAMFTLSKADLSQGVFPVEFDTIGCSQPPPEVTGCVAGLQGIDGCGWSDVGGATVHGGFVGISDCAPAQVHAVDDSGAVVWSYPLDAAPSTRLLSIEGGPLVVSETAAGVLLVALDGGDGSAKWTRFYPDVAAANVDSDGSRALIVLDQVVNPLPSAPNWLVVVGGAGIESDLMFSIVYQERRWQVAVAGDKLCLWPSIVPGPFDIDGVTGMAVSDGDCRLVGFDPGNGIPGGGMIWSYDPYEEWGELTAVTTATPSEFYYLQSLTAADGSLLVLGGYTFGYPVADEPKVALGESYPLWNPNNNPRPKLRRISETHIAVETVDGWRGGRWDLGLCEAP